MTHFAKALLVGACLVGACLVGLSGGAAFADTVQLKADLTPGAQVPPVQSSGSGMFAGTLDTATHKLDYTVTYSGLTGPATMAHFHGPATATQNAGVAVPFKGSLDSPMRGEVTLTPEQQQQLLSGMYYVNVHTAANKGGEIRGQVEKQ